MPKLLDRIVSLFLIPGFILGSAADLAANPVVTKLAFFRARECGGRELDTFLGEALATRPLSRQNPLESIKVFHTLTVAIMEDEGMPDRFGKKGDTLENRWIKSLERSRWTVFIDEHSPKLSEPGAREPFTERELKILALYGRGWTTLPIAERLNIWRTTVHKDWLHIRQILFGSADYPGRSHWSIVWHLRQKNWPELQDEKSEEKRKALNEAVARFETNLASVPPLLEFFTYMKQGIFSHEEMARKRERTIATTKHQVIQLMHRLESDVSLTALMIHCGFRLKPQMVAILAAYPLLTPVSPDIAARVRELFADVCSVAGARGFSKDQVDKVVRETPVAVFWGEGQSDAQVVGGVRIFLRGDIAHPDQARDLIETLSAEAGHRFHQVLVEQTYPLKYSFPETPAEVFDAVSRITVLTRVHREYGVEASLDVLKNAIRGQALQQALSLRGIAQEDFHGGDTPISRDVLTESARWISKELSLGSSAQERLGLFGWVYRMARDFFLVDPVRSAPVPYGVHHMFGALLARVICYELAAPFVFVELGVINAHWDRTGSLLARWTGVAQPEDYFNTEAFYASLQRLGPELVSTASFDDSEAVARLRFFIDNPLSAGIQRGESPSKPGAAALEVARVVNDMAVATLRELGWTIPETNSQTPGPSRGGGGSSGSAYPSLRDADGFAPRLKMFDRGHFERDVVLRKVTSAVDPVGRNPQSHDSGSDPLITPAGTADQQDSAAPSANSHISRWRKQIQRAIRYSRLSSNPEFHDHSDSVWEEWEEILLTRLSAGLLAPEPAYDLIDIASSIAYGEILLTDFRPDPLVEISIPHPIKPGENWPPAGLQEREITRRDLQGTPQILISLIQNQLRTQGISHSLFLIGSSLIDKPGADIDVMISLQAFLEDAIPLLILGTRLIQELTSMGFDESRTRDAFFSSLTGIVFLRRTIEKYQHAYRITSENLFKIFAAPAAREAAILELTHAA